MKKVLTLLAFLCMAIMLCGAALAEEVAPALPTEPFTWEYLATIAGATLATMLIVQLLKLPMDKVWKIPTRIIVYVIALVISLLATQFTAGLTVQNGLLTAVNAVIVALAAMGTYDITFKKLEQKKTE